MYFKMQNNIVQYNNYYLHGLDTFSQIGVKSKELFSFFSVTSHFSTWCYKYLFHGWPIKPSKLKLWNRGSRKCFECDLFIMKPPLSSQCILHLLRFSLTLIITDNVCKWQSHFNSHKQYRIVYINGICTCEVFFFIPKQVSTPSWSAIAT